MAGEREVGHYWLKSPGGWTIAEWSGFDWQFIGSLYLLADDDEQMSNYEIGPRIDRNQ